MIISRTPFRISLFGGGTDYPGWYRNHGGAVLAATIDKYCYLTCRHLPPFFEHQIRVVYSHIENCRSIDEIKHPAVREILRYLNFSRDIEIHHDGDLPARSGIGSSSAFTVGLLHALYALQARMVSKHQLAMESIQIEQNILQETVGSQDQVCAAYGGLNHIVFHQNGEITVRPVIASTDRYRDLNNHLMLFYTGIKRTASDIAESYVTEIDSRKRQLRLLKDLTDESLDLLIGHGDICAIGELLDEAWQVKRSLSTKVSNEAVDEIYQIAKQAGALGGKLLGAGGGGFLLLFAPRERQEHIMNVLNKLIYVPFKFEFSGSQIIFMDQEVDYSHLEKSRENRPIPNFRELET
jgi:D-glycero-alpha-D-manno-heptose-7-phosphate kinase